MTAETNPRFRRWPPDEHEAISAFAERYADAGGYAVVPQVRNGTGFTRSPRTADALMFSLWPSRGITITGIEYKRTKSDFRREIKDGSKAEDIAAYCHHWAILAPAGLIQQADLPPLWGLYNLTESGKIHVAKRAPAQQQIKPLDYIFVAAIVRAVLRHKSTDGELEAEYQRGRKDGGEYARIDREQLERQSKSSRELARRIRAFEDVSGLSLTSLDEPQMKQLGYSVARYLADPDRFTSRLETQRGDFARLLDQMDEVIGGLSSKQPKTGQ